MLDLPPPSDDGLLIPDVGEWSRDKHHFLMRYIVAFTTSMKKDEKKYKWWDELHYIDIFAGAGIERLESSKKLDWGSPLIAAQAKFPFSRLHLCELDNQKYSDLKARIDKVRPESQVLLGDANEKIHEIVREIPDRKTLSLAFLDPYGLHLNFETLKILANKRTDLIIFFPDHLDALRNWKYNYRDNPNSNLDRVLGHETNWREKLQTIHSEKHAEALKEIYVSQLKTLGYSEFEYERILMKGHPLYLLIFCSNHKVGAKIWRGISGKKADGQRTFDFG